MAKRTTKTTRKPTIGGRPIVSDVLLGNKPGDWRAYDGAGRFTSQKLDAMAAALEAGGVLIVPDPTTGNFLATIYERHGSRLSVSVEPATKGVRDDGRYFYIIGAEPKKKPAGKAARRKRR